ncbi:MAG: hypothetical protein JWM96_1040 [Alphaproteobacteria bacterium]|nr:hypothetical protein [Alphaproteobacteria bacterium]
MSQQTAAAIEEIIVKVSHWKNVFKKTAEEALEETIPEEADGLSYAEILDKAKNTDLSVNDINYAVMQAFTGIGAFSANAKELLHSPGYKEAKTIANYIFSNYNDDLFAQQSMEGPLIACPPHLEDTKLAAVFHASSHPLLEMFYETKDENLIELPDVFVLENSNLYTIKAMRSLDENPVFKERIKALNLAG